MVSTAISPRHYWRNDMMGARNQESNEVIVPVAIPSLQRSKKNRTRTVKPTAMEAIDHPMLSKVKEMAPWRRLGSLKKYEEMPLKNGPER